MDRGGPPFFKGALQRSDEGVSCFFSPLAADCSVGVPFGSYDETALVENVLLILAYVVQMEADEADLKLDARLVRVGEDAAFDVFLDALPVIVEGGPYRELIAAHPHREPVLEPLSHEHADLSVGVASPFKRAEKWSPLDLGVLDDAQLILGHLVLGRRKLAHRGWELPRSALF